MAAGASPPLFFVQAIVLLGIDWRGRGYAASNAAGACFRKKGWEVYK